MTLFELLASGTAGSAVTGILAYFTRKQELGKLNAEIQKIKADAEKVEAEADDLVSARLIRELDRLSALNAGMSVQLLEQSRELNKLRGLVMEYAAREQHHAFENAVLRKELEKFVNADSPMLMAIRANFGTPVFDKVPNEFEEEEPPPTENQ